MTPDQIMTTLSDGVPLTIAEIISATGIGETTVRKHVKTLTQAGRLVQSDGPNGSKQFAAVKDTLIADAPPPTPTAPDVPTPVKSGRPGPRPGIRKDDIMKRDESVLAEVVKAGDKGIATRELAAKMGLEPSITYISLWRLNRDKKITKINSGTRVPTWKVA